MSIPSRCPTLLPISPLICMFAASSSTEPVDHQVQQSQSQVQRDKSEGGALEATGLPEVCQPTAAEIAKHSLTHLPYKRWCKFCVAARMLNAPHFTRPPFSRTSPLLVLDYAFVKHAGDDAWLTVLVGRVYPSRALFAVPRDQRGPDP